MDVNRLISGVTQSGIASGLAAGVAGGAGLALLSRKGRKHAGTLLKAGGLALIGGLAWQAYRSYRAAGDPAGEQPRGDNRVPAGGAAAGRSATVMPLRSAIAVAEDPEAPGNARGLLIVRAMIAAASADGHIDGREKDRIFARVDDLDLSAAEKGLLFDELSAPASLIDIAEEARALNAAAEVYTASLLAIDAGCARGRVYLQDLSEILVLPPILVRRIHEAAAVEPRDAGRDSAPDEAA